MNQMLRIPVSQPRSQHIGSISLCLGQEGEDVALREHSHLGFAWIS